MECEFAYLGPVCNAPIQEHRSKRLPNLPVISKPEIGFPSYQVVGHYQLSSGIG
ncbi:hypothetical protein PISMIDRAFT_680295 [Pisolithus microcarpus 441]|uniref:Uncharacterized protein n=1 Tax=Pisolithus microcarpus 441 TaxID=765257 RepID=A0A0C9ZRU7_9AGAM|nr:hypothetical protein PISMIDRAFT_680295 [Pisolithus microcarpus 441]